ncbi:MAG: prepilin-type N-terminal cleavage/methylation domain-containing protein [Planctomycetes bacterium]|nr:prepilin-type N-terminal cleavage/methylation domain-containing protein [Planctomycetota bacterium]
MTRRGFTLLEVLLTLVLLVLVLGVLHACLGAILASTEHGRAVARAALEGRNLLALIESDLRGAVLVPPKPAAEKDSDGKPAAEEDPNAFVAEPGRVRFATASPPRGEGAHTPRVVRLVEYTLKPIGKKRLMLTRSARPVDGAVSAEAWKVTDRVRSLGLQFSDGKEWADVWDSQSAGCLPRAVRIDLAVMVGKKTGGAGIDLRGAVVIQTAPLEPPEEEEMGARKK